jgi:hypothetical protein
MPSFYDIHLLVADAFGVLPEELLVLFPESLQRFPGTP